MLPSIVLTFAFGLNNTAMNVMYMKLSYPWEYVTVYLEFNTCYVTFLFTIKIRFRYVLSARREIENWVTASRLKAVWFGCV